MWPVPLPGHLPRLAVAVTPGLACVACGVEEAVFLVMASRLSSAESNPVRERGLQLWPHSACGTHRAVTPYISQAVTV